MVCVLRYFCSLRVTPLDWDADLPASLLLCLHRSFLSRLLLSTCVPAFLIPMSAGISTCFPSTTHLCLALGPDLPRADQLYPGILGYLAWMIPTSISLLIPAFSLVCSPLLFISTASPCIRCSPTDVFTYIPRLR